MGVTIPEGYQYDRPIPRGQTAVTPYRVPDAPEGTLAGARALEQTGRQLEYTANETEKWGERLDTAQAQEALNKLREKRSELTIGDNGFMRIKGGDVLKPGPDGQPIFKSFPGQMSRASDEIGMGLTTPRARALYRSAAVREVTAYGNDVAKHGLVQSEKYEAATFVNTVTLKQNQGIANADDPKAVETTADELYQMTLKRNEGLGMPGEAAAFGARSAFLKAVIVQRLAGGDNRGAVAAFERYKDKLDGNDRVALAEKTKSAAASVEAEDYIARKSGTGLHPNVEKWRDPIMKASGRTGIAPALIGAVVWAESNGNATAISPAGAGGPAQFMPGTAKDMGVKNVFDPDEAIPKGAEYLKIQLDRFGGNLTAALAAYNWGPERVSKWLAAGADFSKLPNETQGYIKKILKQVGAGGVGFDKASLQTIAIEARDDPSLSPSARALVMASIQKEASITESARTAQIKGLDDSLEAVTQAMIAVPGTYRKGTLATLAEGYEASGDKSKAINTRLLAANEDFLLAFSQSPDAAQKRIVEGLLPGKAKALAAGILAGDSKAATEAGKAARSELGGLKEAAAAGLDLGTMEKKAKGAVDQAVKANDPLLAREIIDTYNAHVIGLSIGRAPPAAQQKAIDEMRAKVAAGEDSNAQIEAVRVTQQIRTQQEAAFKKDAFAAGTALYPDVGTAAPLDNIPARIEQARKISAHRGGLPVIPFTEEDVATIRQKIDGSEPAVQAQTMRQLAALPADMIPHVAASLAGKGESDPLSRSYAAALSFYAEKDPASHQVADKILRGAKLIRDGGDAGRKPATTSDDWQNALQDRMGGVFRDLDAKVPAVIADAVASVYVYQMHRAGKPGDKTDADVLDAAIKSVIGEPVTRPGQSQAFLPPVKGMDSYGVERAIRSLSDGDLDGLRTTEGDPVTADVVIRKGILTNAGAEGLYFVRIPDPRAGMEPRPVVGPDGRAWRLDLRPLIERSRMFPEDARPAPVPLDLRRRAPASPTEGLAP